MSRGDAFDQEMQSLREITDGDEELTAFARDLRATLITPPTGAVATGLPVRLALEARAAAPTDPRSNGGVPRGRPSRRPALARPLLRIALAVAAIPLLFTGLAFAGVKLPEAANAPFESIGIDLPNQSPDGGGGGGADDDTEGTARDGDSAGSDTGQSNSSGKRGHGKAKADDPARPEGDQGNGRAVGPDGTPPGQAEAPADQGGEGDAVGGPDSPPGQGQSNSPGPPEDPGSQGKGSGGVQNKGSSGSQRSSSAPDLEGGSAPGKDK